MGYTTDFEGKLDSDKPFALNHADYLRKFCDTRRMRRNANMASSLPDPVREAAGLPIGKEAEFFVGGVGFCGQDDDKSVISHNDSPTTQPSLWCNWTVSDDNSSIVWNESEKFYSYIEWLEYLNSNFIKPWGYILNGTIKWQGEDPSDCGKIIVINNELTITKGRDRTRSLR